MNPLPETWTIVTYVIYPVLTALVTRWIVRSLDHHLPFLFATGRDQDDQLTRSLIRLVLVGFFLVSFGAIGLTLSTGKLVSGGLECVELLSSKIGGVLLAQGGVYLFVLGRIMAHRNLQSPSVRQLEGSGT